jgi:hypothetical protein
MHEARLADHDKQLRKLYGTKEKAKSTEKWLTTVDERLAQNEAETERHSGILAGYADPSVPGSFPDLHSKTEELKDRTDILLDKHRQIQDKLNGLPPSADMQGLSPHQQPNPFRPLAAGTEWTAERKVTERITKIRDDPIILQGQVADDRARGYDSQNPRPMSAEHLSNMVTRGTLLSAPLGAPRTVSPEVIPSQTAVGYSGPKVEEETKE